MTRTLVLVGLMALACGGNGNPGSGGGAGGSGGAGGGPAIVSLGSYTTSDGGTAEVRGTNPRFSPDSTRIAYVRKEETELVAVMNATGAASRTLANDANYLTGFAWKADGSALLYTGSSPKWVPLDGGSATLVFTGGGLSGFAALDPDLSPNGNTLVYGVNGSDLKLVDLTQASPTEAALAGTHGSSPRFSPDGTTLAYNSGGKITLMVLSTKQTTEVLDSNNFFGSVDWFKDGKHLVVGSDQGIEIVTIGPPVTRKVVSTQFAAMSVDLSPDEKSIVFTVNGQPGLYVLTGF